jgi:hypothetical protein
VGNKQICENKTQGKNERKNVYQNKKRTNNKKYMAEKP